jgi:hypothetical protein
MLSYLRKLYFKFFCIIAPTVIIKTRILHVLVNTLFHLYSLNPLVYFYSVLLNWLSLRQHIRFYPHISKSCYLPTKHTQPVSYLWKVFLELRISLKVVELFHLFDLLSYFVSVLCWQHCGFPAYGKERMSKGFKYLLFILPFPIMTKHCIWIFLSNYWW